MPSAIGIDRFLVRDFIKMFEIDRELRYEGKPPDIHGHSRAGRDQY
jgi:hypothetical protein